MAINHTFVGAVLISPTNLFVGAAGVISRPYKSIYRGGWEHQPSLQNRFVGAAVVPAAPIISVCRGGSV